ASRYKPASEPRAWQHSSVTGHAQPQSQLLTFQSEHVLSRQQNPLMVPGFAQTIHGYLHKQLLQPESGAAQESVVCRHPPQIPDDFRRRAIWNRPSQVQRHSAEGVLLEVPRWAEKIIVSEIRRSADRENQRKFSAAWPSDGNIPRAGSGAQARPTAHRGCPLR